MTHVISRLVLFSIITVAVQAQVTVDLTIEPSGVGWTVFGRVNDPANQTLGLHGMTLDVTGSSGATVGYSYIQTPLWTEANFTTLKFFTKGFSATRFDSETGLSISSSQPLVNRISTLSSNNNLLEGIGECSFTESNVQNPPRTADCPVTISGGEFSGTGMIRATSSVANTTLLPSSLPPATSAGAAFEPITPTAVRGASWVTSGSTVTTNSISYEALSLSGNLKLNARATGGQDSFITVLKFFGGGQIDIADNSLTILQTSVATASGWLHSSQVCSSLASGSLTLGMRNEASAVFIQRAIQGDANLDGRVNTLDFNLLSGSFGSGGAWDKGDFNYDGSVNSADFNTFVGNYGALFPGTACLGAMTPEPAGILLLLAVISMCRTRR